MSAGEIFLRDIEGVYVAPTSMTMASMTDCLAESVCKFVRPGHDPSVIEFNSLTILADELSALIHKWDLELMAGLTKIYDGASYAQFRRGGDLRIKIEHPQINFIAGTTPSNLLQFMPDGAWEQGFASRTIMVYSGERRTADMFADYGEISGQQILHNNLLQDLHSVYSMHGQFKITQEAVQAFRQWIDDKLKPVPQHPKLEHYCSRRASHTLKLCQIASAARSSDMMITKEDFETARNWLLGAEMTMPEIFKAGSIGADSKIMDEVLHFVWGHWTEHETWMDEHQLVYFIRARVISQVVLSTIDIMERDGSLISRMNVKTGRKEYRPGMRRVFSG